MSEWAKVQSTNGSIVGFQRHGHEISTHHGALYGVAGITDHEITIIDDWGGEVSFPRSMFDELGGYLAGTFMEGIADD